MEYTIQCRLHDIGSLWCPLSHPTWIDSRIQHHRVPIRPRFTQHLHDFNRMRFLTQSQGRVPSTSSLEPRSIWHIHQRLRIALLSLHHCISMFPYFLTGGSGFGKLGTIGVGSSHDTFGDYIFRSRQEALHCACGVCGRQES